MTDQPADEEAIVSLTTYRQLDERFRIAAAEIVALRAENEQLQADNVRMANVLAHPIMQACLGLNPQITSGGLSTNPTNQGAK